MDQEQWQPLDIPQPRKHVNRYLYVAVIIASLIMIAVVLTVILLSRTTTRPEIRIPEWIDQQIVEVNGAGRRGISLDTVRNIAVHYVGNPGTTAIQNRNYFNQPTTTVSSHFIVGLDGEIVQCVPLNEISSATNHRNSDTISIEVCHPDVTGQFTEKTYRSLVRLCDWLCREYGLEATDIIRHYDVTGKRCPLYYVEHPEAWDKLVQDVADYKE